MENIQHDTEQSIGQRGSQKKKKLKTLLQTKMEIQHQKFWNAAKAVLREMFITINAYLRKQKMS